MRARSGIVLSCEHGGHGVPARYRERFAGATHLLESHRGWDPGALVLAKALARALGAPLVASTTTRLLVDLNRSKGNPSRIGVRVRTLSPTELEGIDRLYYDPYRLRVERAVSDACRRQGSVVHLSVHSFTPVLRGARRRADVGVLYDPKRPAERALADRIMRQLLARRPTLRVRRNYPYRGASDALVSAFRRRYAPDSYVALELELNQRFVRDPLTFRRMRVQIVDALVASQLDLRLPDQRSMSGASLTP